MRRIDFLSCVFGESPPPTFKFAELTLQIRGKRIHEAPAVLVLRRVKALIETLSTNMVSTLKAMSCLFTRDDRDHANQRNCYAIGQGK
jgi:hypothetical protein